MKKTLFVIIFLAILTFLILFTYDYYILPKLTVENLQVPTSGELVDDENIIVEVAKKEDINMKMSVIGDIMCHNSQYKDAYINNNYDFSYVFEDIKKYIDSADISIGNLETTFAGSAKGYSNYPRFNTPEQLANNLKDFGIDVVSTANNHCLDTGYFGLDSTLNFLDEVGISHTGTSRSKEEQDTVLIKDVNGIKIAFLAFTYGTNGIPIPNEKDYCVNLIDDDFILEQLELAKAQNPDLICASMHWGMEYQTTQNAEQERLANLLFTNGVDIILGSHPHVLQPMEKRTVTLPDGSTKECFVIFSLGNFMSGQVYPNTRNSAILNINITKNGETGKISIGEVSYIPIYMYKYSNKSTQKYLVMDIENAISNFENSSNTNISQSDYNVLKSELRKIKDTLGENLD